MLGIIYPASYKKGLINDLRVLFFVKKGENMEFSRIEESVQTVAKKWNIKQAFLFGSYARGEATETSDIDLILDVPDGTTYIDLGEISNELSTLLGVSIDITTLDSVLDSPRFYKHIQDDLIEIIIL